LIEGDNNLYASTPILSVTGKRPKCTSYLASDFVSKQLCVTYMVEVSSEPYYPQQTIYEVSSHQHISSSPIELFVNHSSTWIGYDP